MPFKPLSDGEVLAQVRALARAGKAVPTNHLRERMELRQIDWGQVVECLKLGRFVERPTIPNRSGAVCYEFKMGGVFDGEAVAVAAALYPERRVIVMTTM